MERICSQYFAEVEKDKVAFEKSLEVEASKAAMEKYHSNLLFNDDSWANNRICVFRDMAGAAGDEDDHDTRKLTKADRMRLVVKNKEEGNELFKGTNYRPAAARYHKALSHCSKFYDVSEDDKKEIKALKLSLYLNLASCYLKMELFDQVIRNVDDALEIDPLNPKAFFRRSAAYEGKKDFDKALVRILLHTL